MVRLCSAAVALSAVLYPASALRVGRILEGDILPSDIIVDRPESIFRTEYEIGSTYRQHIEMDQTSKMSLGGIDVEQKTHMDMDAECAVSEVAEPVGGREVDMTFIHLGMTMDAGGISMSFDSNEPEGVNPAFKPLLDMVGQPMTVITDKDGKVVEASDHEGLLKEIGRGGGAGQDPVQDMASPKQFEQISRMAKAVPADRAIKPGDEWDVEDLDMDGMLVFTGTGNFPGFRMHADSSGEEHEVAVFALEGTFEMDLEKLGDALELDEDESAEDEAEKAVLGAAKNVKITEGRLTVTLYWDNEDKFIRWMELTQSMVMQMPNPVDQSVMEIPTDQVIKTSVEKM